MLEVKPEVAETAMNLSPVLHQKHSPGGCTVDMPLSNCRQQGHIISLYDIPCCNIDFLIHAVQCLCIIVLTFDTVYYVLSRVKLLNYYFL